MKQIYTFESTPNFQFVQEVVKQQNFDPNLLSTDDIACILKQKQKQNHNGKRYGKRYATKLETIIILKALRKTIGIPRDAQEKVIYLMREFLSFLFRKRIYHHAKYSLDYFTYLYLFDQHFDINLGLTKTERAITVKTREVTLRRLHGTFHRPVQRTPTATNK